MTLLLHSKKVMSMKNAKYLGFSFILICSTPALSEPLDFYGRLWLGVANSSNGLSGNEKVDGFSLEIMHHI
jgi:hypothetical protein